MEGERRESRSFACDDASPARPRPPRREISSRRPAAVLSPLLPTRRPPQEGEPPPRTPPAAHFRAPKGGEKRCEGKKKTSPASPEVWEAARSSCLFVALASPPATFHFRFGLSGVRGASAAILASAEPAAGAAPGVEGGLEGGLQASGARKAAHPRRGAWGGGVVHGSPAPAARLRVFQMSLP